MMRGAGSDARAMASIIGLAAWLALGPGAAGAHEGKHRAGPERAQSGAATKPGSVAVKLFDLELTDRNGRPVKFRSDVIGKRIVVVNFIYTRCTTVCPVTSAIFARLQERLGPRLGEDVFLVSLSVDPVTDEPVRLRAYAKKFNAGPGWIWLTGRKLAVDKVLEGLGAYSPNYEDHPAMVLVGDGRAGRWTRFFGFSGPDEIMAQIDELTAARAHSVSAAARQ